jgi:hypothetical protein
MMWHDWLLVASCLLFIASAALLAGRLTSRWKRMEYDAAKRECRSKWGGGHMVELNEGMSILRRAEGYCLHKALCSKDYEGVRDYLDAANWLNYLWREMWQGVNVAPAASQTPLQAHFGGDHDHQQL